MVASIQPSSASVHLVPSMTPTLTLQNWDEMVRNEQELEFLRQTHEQPEESAVKLLDSVFSDAGRREALFDRLQANPQAFAWVWPDRNREMLETLWDLEIVPRSLEIPFLSAQQHSVDIKLLLKNENRQLNLIAKYQTNTDAIVVIWKTIGDNRDLKDIWNNIVVRRMEEISFLSKQESLGKDLFTHSNFISSNYMKKEWKALIIRYSTDAKAIAVIWKIFGSWKILRNLWDKKIVRNGLELQFLSHIDQPGAATCGNVVELLKEKPHRFSLTRAAALEKKYPQASDQITAFMNHGWDHLHY